MTVDTVQIVRRRICSKARRLPPGDLVAAFDEACNVECEGMCRAS